MQKQALFWVSAIADSELPVLIKGWGETVNGRLERQELISASLKQTACIYPSFPPSCFLLPALHSFQLSAAGMGKTSCFQDLMMVLFVLSYLLSGPF